MNFAVDIPFVDLLGFELEIFEAGEARIRYASNPDHFNAAGVTHGGALMTLLDVAMATAARSVQKDTGLVTIAMNTTFMQTARGQLSCKGRLIHRSESLAFTEATVYDEAGQSCAHATGTFKFMRRPGARSPLVLEPT